MIDPTEPNPWESSLGDSPPRELTASFIVGTLTRHDAIATACRRHMEALRLFCDKRDIRLRLRVYAYSCEVDERDFQKAETAAQVATDDHFQRSELVVYEFGILLGLYDSIHLAPRPARVLVFHYGVTHPHVAPVEARELLHKSYEQMKNLFAADEVFVTSRFVADELRRIGLPMSRVRYLGLPASVGEASAGASRAWPSTGPLRLLYVGRFVPAKGIADLVDAFALHRRAAGPSAELTLIGSLQFSDRSYVESLRERARTLDLNDAVRWRFDVSRSELSEAYDASDAVVIPSYHEGFCVPVVEAYHHGCGVIGSGATALPETIGGLGLTFPCGDVEALAASIASFDAARHAGRMATESGDLDRDDWLMRVTAHLDQFRLDRFRGAMAEVYARNLPSRIESSVRAGMAGARTEVLDQIRAGVAPPPSPLVERLQPLYDLLNAGLVPPFTQASVATTPPAAPVPPSRRRLAWIYFKRAVKRVPVVAPVAVWSKRRIVGGLRRGKSAWSMVKRGVTRVPFVVSTATHAKQTALLPRTVHHHHTLLQEIRHLTQVLVWQVEHLGNLVHSVRVATTPPPPPVETPARLGHGKAMPVYKGRDGLDGPAPGNWSQVHPATYDGALRVVVGCGDDPWSDHINVDAEGIEGADVAARPDALPFPPGSLVELVIRNLPAGTTRHEFEHALLPHWWTLTAPGGVLRIHARNPKAWLERIPQSDDESPMTVARDTWPEALSPNYLFRTLNDRGFVHIRVVAERWVNGLPEVEIAAERRSALRTSA